MARTQLTLVLILGIFLIAACSSTDRPTSESSTEDAPFESDYADADKVAFIADTAPWTFHMVDGDAASEAATFALLDPLPFLNGRDARRVRSLCRLDNERYSCDPVATPFDDGWQKSSWALWQEAPGGHRLLWATDRLEDVASRLIEVSPPPPILGATLRVVDEEGRAVRGAKVQPILGHGAPLSWIDSVVTDERGIVRVTDLPEAPWQFQVTSAIHAPVRMTPRLSLGGTGKPMNVVLPRGVQIDAAVADVAGRRVDDAVAFVSFENPGRDDTTHVAFRIREGRLIASLPRSGPFVLRVKADGYRWWQRRQLDVESIDIHLEPR